MSEQAERLVVALVSGEVTMCQASGCAHTYPTVTAGRGQVRRFCGEKDCPRGKRVTGIHRAQAIKDLRAELDGLKGHPPVAAVQDAIKSLSEALKSDASDEDLRVAAAQLAAAAVHVAATVDALGRGGLSSRATPRPALTSESSAGGPRSLPRRTGAQTDAARAMLEAAG